SSNSGVAGGVWGALRACESGGNYSTNTGNGFYGAYQFTQQTWNGVGMSGSPASASPAQQDAAAQKLQAQSGWGPWPACSSKLGLR
ncbi:MAG TPA: transglycosylase family protein, partial [Acidimicrobiales bacterium]